MARRIGMLNAVIDAVKEVAKQEIIPRYLKVQGHYKSDGSLCTGADIAAQEALIGKLQEIYPGNFETSLTIIVCFSLAEAPHTPLLNVI